jgi:beta-1,4-mannosyltransferase
MQYHAVSLATQAHYQVDLIGYFEGNRCCEEVETNANITKHLLRPIRLPRFIDSHFVLRSLVKPVLQTIVLLYLLLFKIQTPDFMLVQNPPAIPTLFVAHLFCYLRKTKLIIDFHNYGFTLMQMAKRKNHPIIRLAEWYEKRFSKGAYGYFCVSKSMQEDLRTNWAIKAVVLYDRPPAIFREISDEEKHKFFLKYRDLFGNVSNMSNRNVTAFTENGHLRRDRPALLVSSTSWTPDEDFEILFNAIEKCDNFVVERQQKDSTFKFPEVRLIVTGKGPLKSTYEKKIAEKSFTHFKIFTAFLPFNDYAALLGSADLGICLHKSSSGVDLPMKVVDMFGCCLPVCAYKYKAFVSLLFTNQHLISLSFC